MTDFLALLDDADAAIAAHLFTPGVLRPGRADAVDPVPVAIERAVAVAAPVIGQAGFAHGKPVVRMPLWVIRSAGAGERVTVEPRKGDEVFGEGRLWRLVGAATRPGDGRWWQAPVDDLGPSDVVPSAEA